MDFITKDAYSSDEATQSRKREHNKWAEIWFEQLCLFTGVNQSTTWNFSADEVIAFLRSRVQKEDPAWKRLKIIQSLIFYRVKHPVANSPDLKFIETKLKEIAAQEELANDIRGGPIGDTQDCEARDYDARDCNVQNGKECEADADTSNAALSEHEVIEVVGKINSREVDVIQQMRRRLRLMGRVLNTERAYVRWVKRFMVSRNVSTVEECLAVDELDVEAFLTDLVVDGNVAPSTQDQAFYALLFLFEHVLRRKMGRVEALRSSKPKLRPTVMSGSEVAMVLGQLRGRYLLVAQLLYGCGIRISEALRLRVKDIDFDQSLISIFCSKGKKSRLVPLPQKVADRLKILIEDRRRLHAVDEIQGGASVWLPFALHRKFPNAHREFKWQFLFASQRHSSDPKTGLWHRHHISRDSFSKALRGAVVRSGVMKYVTAHTFRHSFATTLLRSGTDIRIVQELLGHADVSTTMIYTHVLMDEKAPVVSPLDFEMG